MAVVLSIWAIPGLSSGCFVMTKKDPSVLDCPQTDTEDDHPILRKEVEAAVQSLKGSQLELTTTQQNWSKQVERM